MKQKQGIQLNKAFGAVLTLVLVSVLVIIAIVLFVSLNNSFAGSETNSVVNESMAITDTGVAVANSTLCKFADFSVVRIDNGTDEIAAANYTASTDGTIVNLTARLTPTWNVTHTSTWGGPACTASDNMTGEFGNYTSLIGLVGTIIFLGLVIGVLVAAFAFGGRREV